MTLIVWVRKLKLIKANQFIQRSQRWSRWSHNDNPSMSQTTSCTPFLLYHADSAEGALTCEVPYFHFRHLGTIGGHSGKIRKAENNEVSTGNRHHLNLINVVGLRAGLPDLANKNTEHQVKIKFQINNDSFL